jgi:hypothetical protein
MTTPENITLRIVKPKMADTPLVGKTENITLGFPMRKTPSAKCAASSSLGRDGVNRLATAAGLARQRPTVSGGRQRAHLARANRYPQPWRKQPTFPIRQSVPTVATGVTPSGEGVATNRNPRHDGHRRPSRRGEKGANIGVQNGACRDGVAPVPSWPASRHLVERSGRLVDPGELERFLREQAGPGLDRPASESYAEVDGRTLTGEKSVPAAGQERRDLARSGQG